MAKSTDLQNQVSKVVLGLLFFLANFQAAKADDCPWADTNPQVVVMQSQDQYCYHQASAKQPVQVQRTVSSMPVPGTYVAKANLALRAVGRQTLPPTRLSSFVRESGMRDDIYGMEGQTKNVKYAPIESGFYGETAAGLTTGHKSDAPAVSTFPTMPAVH